MKRSAMAWCLVILLGCAPRGAASPAVPAEPTPSPPASAADPAPASASAASDPESSSAEAPASDAASESSAWFRPLPALELTTLTEEQQQRSRACIEGHHVQDPDVPAASLMAAATCLAKIPAPGPEIRLYRHLLQHHPDAPEAVDAPRVLGQRFEQIDVRDQAIDAYLAYLRRYPKNADARQLGQRAVCLARSLGDTARSVEILAELERLYARRGFARPDEEALETLCAAAPATPPRPRRSPNPAPG